MNKFSSALRDEIQQSFSNDFGKENFDEYRFGKMVPRIPPPTDLLYLVKNAIKKIIGFDKLKKRKSDLILMEKVVAQFQKYESDLDYLYEHVQQESKELIIKIIAFRLLGFSKVKLPFNSPQYWSALQTAGNLKIEGVQYDPHFMHFILDKFDLAPIGYDIKLFFSEVGIAIDFIAEQYAYKNNERTVIQADEGQTVLDIGGCWGDTALYFAHKVGENGKVYSFEFIPDNIKLFNINLGFNETLKRRVEIICNPVSNISGIPIYFKDNGPGSKIEMNPFDGQTGQTQTISIDDFVKNNNLTSVDFIKMDIEGSEPLALEGAIETIRTFRPTLAIAIYHSMEDFVYIPKWILNLDLDYELFIGHYTIHAEETICFAKPKVR